MVIQRPALRWLGWILLVATVFPSLAACGALGRGPQPAPTATEAPVSPTPEVGASPTAAAPTVAPVVAAPTVAATATTAAPPTAAATPAAQALGATVTSYVNDWQSGKYADMYKLLSLTAQQSITETKFVQRYSDIADGVDQTGVSVLPSLPTDLTPTGNPPSITVPFHVTYHLAVLGDVEEDNQMSLVLENGNWKVNWTPGLIFKDLTATRVVRYDPVNPKRGSVLDRNGNILAEDGTILTVGVVPGQIKNEADLLQKLSAYLKIPSDQIKKAYAGAQPTWFVPIKDLPAGDSQTAQTQLGSLPGVSFQQKTERVYPYGAATSDVVGYLTKVQPDELKNLQAKGYEDGDWIGRAGIEASDEQFLRGQKGATLAIREADGTIVRTIAEKESQPGLDVVTTLDVNYQIAANKILGDKAGSLIVMNPQDNSILALSSEPSFDPNLFILGMSDAQWSAMNTPTRPLLFRPDEGLYPTGSIFKVITMAAGLEKAGFKPSDTFDCGLDWKGPGGMILHNWTAEGTLNLIQSLTGSCDPTFYTIGLKLSQLDPNILSGFARAFGLGQTTGVSGIDDAPGTVPDPAWKQKNIGQPWFDGDGINLAIGQGYLLATPLQMANVYSTLANHGQVRTPVLVSAIKRPDGSVVQSFQAQPRGTIPVSPQNLNYILEGMRGVTSTPLGTAYYAWKGSPIPMEAKTGSAENETNNSHAWFVGFTPPDHPTVLALVMLEGGGLGGEFAAPLGRQIVEYAVAHPEKPAGQ
jgi:penicillin-binding protein 2